MYKKDIDLEEVLPTVASDIVVTPSQFDSTQTSANDLPPWFDSPYEDGQRNHLVPPYKIADIEEQEIFADREFAKTGAITTGIKYAGDEECVLPPALAQFKEFVQKACDYEAQNSPLYQFKSATLYAVAFDAHRAYPPQPFHFDPKRGMEKGSIYHLYSAASSLGTEFTLKKNDQRAADIDFMNDYEINFFSVNCLHRQPEVPISFARVFAGVAFSISASQLKKIERDHGISPSIYIPRR